MTGQGDRQDTTGEVKANDTSSKWSALASRRIFFGHQSVGRDIMGGVRALLADHDGPPVRLMETDRPDSVEGPAFMEARIGRNREPRSKMAAFERIVGSGLGSGDIALLKFCYVDVADDTDVDALYEEYLGSVARIEADAPGVELVHATIPLRTAPAPFRERIGRLLGKGGGSALNLRRELYNERLRRDFPADRIFDVAAVEATGEDGKPAARRIYGRSVPMLAPEWTHDGGHLNARGAALAARELLDVLTRMATPGSDLSTAAGGSTSADLARQ